MKRVAAVAASLLLVLAASGTGAPAPRFGGTVVIGWPTFPPACLNAYTDVCWFGIHPGPLVEKVLAGALEPRPNLTYAPDLARATYRRNPFTVTYRIRPEARWSDGVPVTARDFVFTWQTVIGLDDTAAESPWRRIRRVVPVDAKTVRVVFRAPTGEWRSLFDPVLPRHALAGEDFAKVWRDRIENPKTGQPIGSGPFLVLDWERGRELTLVRNRNYWGPHEAYLDRLVLRWQQQPVPTLTGREVDVMNFSGRPQDFAELARDPGLRILDEPSAGWEHLTIRVRGGHAALASRLVRRALAYGIDREAIVRGVWSQAAPRLRPLHNVLLLAGERGYRPNWSRYSYRPTEARRLLDQAGCRPGDDGFRVCDGERLSLRYLTTVDARRVRTFELVQAQLRRIGVEITPQYLATINVGGYLQRGDFDLAQFLWIRSAAEPDGRTWLCGGAQNFAGHCNRLLDRELLQIPLALDDGKRAEILNAADGKLAEDVPIIPLYQMPNYIAVRRSLGGVVAHPLAGRSTYLAENWWLAR